MVLSSLSYAAAIKGQEESVDVGFCKSINFVGASQTLTATGLDCILTSTASGSSGGAIIVQEASVNKVSPAGTLNFLNGVSITTGATSAVADITLDDASSSSKGIATFGSTFFNVNSGNVTFSIGGDLDVGSFSIDGSSSSGLAFDPDNDGVNEVTFSISGTVTAGGTDERVAGASSAEFIDFNDEGDGKIVLGGSGSTNNENIIFDFETVANGILIQSSTANPPTFKLHGKIASDVDAGTIADSGDGNPATATLTPTRSYVSITCNDVHTCDVTMGETGVLDGTMVSITNVSLNTVDFSDTSGVSELNGSFAMTQYQTLKLLYATDRWVEISRSAN